PRRARRHRGRADTRSAVSLASPDESCIAGRVLHRRTSLASPHNVGGGSPIGNRTGLAVGYAGRAAVGPAGIRAFVVPFSVGPALVAAGWTVFSLRQAARLGQSGHQDALAR